MPSESGFLVWCPDRGHTEDDGVVCCRNPYATPKDAAQHYAQHHCGFSGDPFNCIVVRVRDGAKVLEIEVTVEAVPEFYASSQREVKL